VDPAASVPSFSKLSDEELGRRLAHGEAAAFDELYRRYARQLAAYGARLLGDRAAGEDVAHTALLKAYQALRRGDVPERPRPWLYRIAHRVALDSLAARCEPLATVGADVPSADSHERRLLRGELLAALEQLPDRQRQVYLLREVHGLRAREIGDALELAAAQVEQALFAARNRLAELLVFGERLDCETVRRLSGGDLDRLERRALKAHLRACAPCRGAVGRRRVLILLPFLPTDGLRRLGRLFHRSTAAKAAASVAATAVVASVPLAVFGVARDNAPPAPAPFSLRADSPLKRLVSAPSSTRSSAVRLASSSRQVGRSLAGDGTAVAGTAAAADGSAAARTTAAADGDLHAPPRATEATDEAPASTDLDPVEPPEPAESESESAG